MQGGERELADEVGVRLFLVFGSFDGLYNFVNMVERLFKPLEDVRALLRFFEVIFCALFNNDAAVADKLFQQVFERKDLGLDAVYQRKHVKVIHALKIGMFIDAV